MKALYVLIRTLRQQARDRLGLALTLLTAPAFVIFYAIFFGGAAPTSPVALLTDASAPPGPATAALRAALEDDGTLRVEARVDADVVREELRVGALDAAVVAPQGFEAAVARGDTPAVEVLGDPGAPAFRAAAGRVDAAGQALALPGGPPRAFALKPTATAAPRTAFERYVPALIVFSVIMLVFSSAMAVAREVEAGTWERLRLTALRPASYLLGVSGAQLVLGAASSALTLAVASALGFTSAGSLALALGVVVALGVACVGVGVAVASLARSTGQAFLLAAVAMFLLMLFSGVVFPLPRLAIAQLGGWTVEPLDALPTTWAVAALHRVLSRGASALDVAPQLAAMMALSALYFAAGAAIFGRRYGARPNPTSRQ